MRQQKFLRNRRKFQGKKSFSGLRASGPLTNVCETCWIQHLALDECLWSSVGVFENLRVVFPGAFPIKWLGTSANNWAGENVDNNSHELKDNPAIDVTWTRTWRDASEWVIYLLINSLCVVHMPRSISPACDDINWEGNECVITENW